MPGIAFEQLTKHYGAVTALDGLSVRVAPGRITAFLGANGSGKTTSMRLLLGLSEPDVRQRHHRRTAVRRSSAPDPSGGSGPRPGIPPEPQRPQPPAHRRRTGGDAEGARATRLSTWSSWARWPTAGSAASRSACASGWPWRPRWSGTRRSSSSTSRSTGSTRTASRPCGRSCAASPTRGGTVFLSSHLLAEVAHSADDAIIIDHGRLVTAGPVEQLSTSPGELVVTTDDADLLAVALARRGATVARTGPDTLAVTGVERGVVGRQPSTSAP